MLVVGFLAASALGNQWEEPQAGGCDIPQFDVRMTFQNGPFRISICCLDPAGAVCYNEPNLCLVASDTQRCCRKDNTDALVECWDIPKDQCNDSAAVQGLKWCPDATTTTTTSTNLEPAAIAAIAATPVLLIAAAAGVAL